MDKSHKRDIGIDITRIIAFASVVGVHFFLNTGFYEANIYGKLMCGMIIMRTFFMICVPLFMIMTGVLYSKKEIKLNRKELIKFYKKIFRVISIYLVSTFLLIALMKVVLGISIGGIPGLVSNILSYAQYSWYINMYIGFFFLIPFLNTVWHALDQKQERGLLIIIMFCLTTLPSVLNGHGWMINTIVPNFWVGLYPITYYYIGAYLSIDVKIKKLSKKKLFMSLLICLILFALHNYYHSYKTAFVWGGWNDWGGVECVVESVLVYLIINSFEYANVNKKIKKFLSKVADLTLGAYILSSFSDQFIYRILNEKVNLMRDKVLFFPLTVSFTIVVSLVLSYVVERMVEVFRKAIILIEPINENGKGY